jgi:hypothetical protein
MASGSIDLRLRVIIVTTRAALRHAADAEQRRAIVRRGRELVDELAERSDEEGSPALARAHTELDALERP